MNKENFHWSYVKYPQENAWAEDDNELEDTHYAIEPNTKNAKRIIKNTIKIYLLESQECDMIIASITTMLNNLTIYIYN